MAETKKSRARRAGRRERRYLAAPTGRDKLVWAAGLLGAAGLGAGVYGQFLREEPLELGRWLLGGGALLMAGSLWVGGGEAPVRVGDAGVAVERDDGRVERVLWCDVETIRREGDVLLVQGEKLSVRVPLEAHRVAAAALVAEAKRRVPDVLKLSKEEQAALPAPQATAGEELTVEGVQIAGRSCAESGETITFERDARLCPLCGEAYLKGHVPAECGTCGAELGDRALEVGA